ncbi:hypothetical protein SAZ_42235 [Streptomyces noursei ZPM]|nr:hypothetical protein SAZ_42235 [Streptomyces noursei ZPM]EPY92445.1 hypothetical protein K530_53230 [Streptomyces noursei CCRC 11814]EXU91251.1 hypothetical protein P354_07370 [Streptomyces noursei PD-1]
MMYSRRALWCRWACASASSTRPSSEVAVNSSFSARSNITARSRPICPYSSGSHRLPWCAETFSICSYCWANPPKAFTVFVTVARPPACTARALMKASRAGETFPPSRRTTSSADASSSSPSGAVLVSAVISAAFASASWAGPSASMSMRTTR